VGVAAIEAVVVAAAAGEAEAEAARRRPGQSLAAAAGRS